MFHAGNDVKGGYCVELKLLSDRNDIESVREEMNVRTNGKRRTLPTSLH